MIDIILYYYMYIIIYREKTKARRMEGQRLDGLPSFPPRPRSIPSGGDVGQKKRPTRKRENQGEGCRRPLRPFLASPSVPSAASTVHTIASRSPPRHRRTSKQSERKGGHPVRFWAMLSPHIATTSPPDSNRDGRTSSRLSLTVW